MKNTLKSLIKGTNHLSWSVFVKCTAHNLELPSLSTSFVTRVLAPDIPVIDQAYSKLSNSITVEWRAVPGATSYLLSAQDGDSCIETVVTKSPGTVMGLEPATCYRITIRSVNAGGKSRPSPSRKTTTGGFYFYFSSVLL